MKKVEFEATLDKNGCIYIIPIADVHIGSEENDLEYFGAVLRYIENHDNVYCLLNGDLIENSIANPKCPSSVFNQSTTPLEQCVLVSNMLSKVAEQKKIINCTIGNHENRTRKETGLTPMDLIVSNLAMKDEGLLDRYSPEGCYTFLRLKSFNRGTSSLITIFNQHGSGGGATIGSATNKLFSMKRIIPAHIFVRSHTHKPEILTGTFLMPDLIKHDLKEERCVMVSNGAFMRYGGYGLYNGYEPQDNSMPMIKIQIHRCQKKTKGKAVEWYEKEITAELKSKEFFMNNK